MEILRTQLNVGFAIMLMMIDVNVDVKVRNHCYILENIETAHRNFIIKVKLNGKIPVVFHNLKTYDSHLIMQELGKLNLKINVMINRLEKFMSFNVNIY